LAKVYDEITRDSYEEIIKDRRWNHLAGAFAGAMTSFFGRKLPGPPDDRDS
jgi:hypothetical protein